jgi:hypothetical protein
VTNTLAYDEIKIIMAVKSIVTEPLLAIVRNVCRFTKLHKYHFYKEVFPYFQDLDHDLTDLATVFLASEAMMEF